MNKIKKFLNCKTELLRNVFKPRIETEFWVGKAIKETQRTTNNDQRTIKVLDVFTGTGCIGIAVLKNIKNALVDFVDISKDAISQIKINLKLNGIPKNRYKIYQSNLFENLKNRRYDLIFANPPYVALDRIQEVQKEVLQKEPLAALFGGKDGMFWIKKFLKEIKKHLNKKGVVFMEFDPLQKEEVERILKKEGFKFQFRKDQFKKYRWLKTRNL